MAKQAINQGGKYTPEQIELGTGILRKVYDAGGEDALVTFIKSNGREMPPIKLTNRELEFMSGGAKAAQSKAGQTKVSQPFDWDGFVGGVLASLGSVAASVAIVTLT